MKTKNDHIVREFLGDQLLIAVDDNIYNVNLWYKGIKPIEKDAYIKGDLVYVYHGGENEFDEPGIYYEDGKYVFVEPTIEREKYSVENVDDLDTDAIIEDVLNNAEEYVTKEEVEKINNNSSLFVPEIKETDDFLKKMIKKAIIDKKINLKNYKDKPKNKWTLNNLRMALNNKTSMSINYFRLWCEILGLDLEMVLKDNGTDKISPLPQPIKMNLEDM